MMLKSPAWIDNEYIKKTIQDGNEKRQIIVMSFDISSAVPPGYNYGSDLWRVIVKYRENSSEDIQDTSLIVKAPHQDEGWREFMDPFARVEVGFYYELMPFLSNKTFAPKSFISAVSGAIVMEDLCAKGYVMADRSKGLDYDECRLYAAASATFHAATAAAYKNNPELVESLGREKLFPDEQSEFTKGFKRFLIIIVWFLADQMENTNNFKKYAGLLRSFADRIWDKLVEAHKRSKTLNVLGQGDPWITNMMFKYDSSGKAVAVKLLDFQALRYSSPIADLLFFVWISASHEVREDHLEDLYRFYCDTLNSKLEEFNCSERLTYEQLQATIKRFYPLIIYMITFNPFLNSAEFFDFGEVIKKTVDDKVTNEALFNMLSRYYTEDYSQKELPRFLKQLESIGMFRYLKHTTYL